MSPTKDDPLLAQFRAQLENLEPQVIRPAEGLLQHDFCVPGGYYNELWDWDGFFIAVHLAGRGQYGPRYLQSWALNFLDAADPTGYVPGCITPQGPETGHRSFQMKPFLAQGVELAGRLFGDDTWSSHRYDQLCRIATRRESTHRDEVTGLFVWDTAVQSGADNNPALSNDPAERETICACDLNAFQWREYLALSRLADRLGRRKDSQRFAERADILRRAVAMQLWSGPDGTFFNRRRGGGDFCRHITYSNFVPLWAGMVPPDRAETMIDRYLWNEQHLLSPFGLRSLSRQDAAYKQREHHPPVLQLAGPDLADRQLFLLHRPDARRPPRRRRRSGAPPGGHLLAGHRRHRQPARELRRRDRQSAGPAAGPRRQEQGVCRLEPAHARHDGHARWPGGCAGAGVTRATLNFLKLGRVLYGPEGLDLPQLCTVHS